MLSPCRCVELIINEQMRKYTARLKDISSLEFAESKAKSRLMHIKSSLVRSKPCKCHLCLIESAVCLANRLWDDYTCSHHFMCSKIQLFLRIILKPFYVPAHVLYLTPPPTHLTETCTNHC